MILACALMVLARRLSRPEPVWETVDDEVVQPVSAAEAPMEIVFDVPEEAELLGEADCWRAYAHPDGDYAIAARTIAAADLDEAVYAVSGYSAGTTAGGRWMQGEGRCSFGWYAPETDGGRLYPDVNIVRPRLLLRACRSTAPAQDAGTTYHSTEEQVFASFGLIS
ncbi:MAG: hypothetical protein V8T01_04420 [Oscillospiraceae bacterium]